VSHSQPDHPQAELQDAALAHMRALESVRAPDTLRRSIEQMADDAAARPRRRVALPRLQAPIPMGAGSLRLRLAGAGALVAAAAAVVVAIFLSSGSPSTPTMLQASRVALAPATLASPTENPRDRTHLAASVEGLAYPYWGGQRGWPAAGARRDRLGGRSVTTVFYTSRSGARVGYAIVAGRPLAEPTTGTVLSRGGVRFRVLDAAGATVVTWREAGHTCILAARGVPARVMVRLVLS
jgi:hypothetical protein